jgi:cysteinyl-tRNA synthetase
MAMLTIYNTLSRQKEIFTPIAAPKVNMYVCGMTVYDYCHIGHARMVVVFDMVARWLRASGYELTYIRNITDIDDKIIQRAAENHETIQAVTDRFIAAMHEDFDALGARRPDAEPRATQFIGKMQEIITELIVKGMAYTAPNGDVYYAVRQFLGYGKLSGKSLEDLRAGERVEIDQYKRDPLDFVLWKAAKPGEPSWNSPWGEGRPGWHIECSAMSESYLGQYFDIHGGGQDLQFPHHENEIAQSEGAHGHDFVKYWLHNGFVRVDNEKMSKSLGNFFTIRDVLKRYVPEVVRFFILRAHYRSQLNYSDANLDDAKNSLTKLYLTLQNADINHSDKVAMDWHNAYAKRFKAAMDDDFNTVEAIAVLFELAHEINKTHSALLATLLYALGGVLGILQDIPEHFLKGAIKREDEQDYTPAQIEALIAARDTARANKDFIRADEVRDTLIAAGVILEDTAQGTLWRRK